MNKLLLLFFVAFFGFHLNAQETSNKKTCSKSCAAKCATVMKTINRFSVTTSISTMGVAPSEFNKMSISKITMSELNISYKLNRRVSIGVSSVGALGNRDAGYYDAEGQFSPFCNEDDDEHDDDDDDEHDDDDEYDDDDDDDCEGDEMGENMMANVTIKLSEKFPLFIQAGGGYSFGSKAPAYTAMIGYNQKLFHGFGVLAGIRYSDVLRSKPLDAVSLTNSKGLKMELGLSWNF